MQQEDTELALFRESVQRFLRDQCLPHYVEWERKSWMPREIWSILGENGCLCVDQDEAYGGSGVPFEYSAVVLEEASRLGLGSLATGLSVHSDICAPYIQHMGTDTQKTYWLPRLVSGKTVAAIAMTEPGAGSDLQGMRSTAIRQDDGYILNGSKTFITNGQHADMVIVAAKTDPQAGAKGVSLFLVDTSLPGFQRGRKLEKLGLHSQDTSELFFDQVHLPLDALLGQEGQGFGYLMQELPRERLAIAITAVAAAEGVFEETKNYVMQRQAFGKPLSQLQNTRFVLAQCLTDIRCTRAFLDECKRLYSMGELDVPTAAMIKMAATELQNKVADSCLQLHGGYGYMTEYAVARAFVDARVQRIYGGTNEIMKEVIARSILGR